MIYTYWRNGKNEDIRYALYIANACEYRYINNINNSVVVHFSSGYYRTNHVKIRDVDWETTDSNFYFTLFIHENGVHEIDSMGMPNIDDKYDLYKSLRDSFTDEYITAYGVEIRTKGDVKYGVS
jgi:hypothetical protein